MLKHYLIIATFPLFILYALFVFIVWPFLWFAPEYRKRLVFSLFGWLARIQKAVDKLAGKQ